MNGVQHKVVGTGAGIAVAYILVAGMNEPVGALVVGTSIVGCMLPDIDHDKTKIGRKRKFVTELSSKVINTLIYGGIVLGVITTLALAYGFVNFGLDPVRMMIGVAGLIAVAIAKKIIMNSKTVRWAAKHRGLMHTLVVPILLYVLMGMSDFSVWHYGVMGLLIGYCSHLFADMQTVEGCPVLFPLTKNNVRIMKLRTKEKSCTKWAYIDAILMIGLAYFIATRM